MSSIYDLTAARLGGGEEPLSAYRDKVLLIVNVASKCGFTPQYAGLEKLYKTYKNQGVTILGFPCNQFGAQEPGDAKTIADFCSLNYEVSFPLFAKVEVNGPGTHPVYQFLKKAKKGLLGTADIKWNFTKFLLDRKGEVVGRYGPQTKPEDIEKDVKALI